MVADLRSGAIDEEIPPHGTLARVLQPIPVESAAGNAAPPDGAKPPRLRACPRGKATLL